MKFIHISDLHLGKNLNGYSLIDDQKYILNEILKIADDEKIDGVFISGDVYDKSVSSVEAVKLLDSFLQKLVERDLYIFIISGNHDSAERLAFGNKMFERANIFISSVFDGNVPRPITVEKHGERVNVYLLPFIKPVNVRIAYPDEKIETYTDAIRSCIDKMVIDKNETNILLTHQAVMGAERCDSENKFQTVGGTDIVSADVFDDFDYVALGHIHTPQNVCGDLPKEGFTTCEQTSSESKGRENPSNGVCRVRYCGTPLKYSFSEAKRDKSVTVVDILENKKINVYTRPLKPLRDMVELRGTYDELTYREFYKDTTYCEDYVHITLTDEQDVYDAKNKLQTIYHNLMTLDYDNSRTKRFNEPLTEFVESASPGELFEQFFIDRNGREMTDEQKKILDELIERIWEDR